MRDRATPSKRNPLRRLAARALPTLLALAGLMAGLSLVPAAESDAPIVALAAEASRSKSTPVPSSSVRDDRGPRGGQAGQRATREPRPTREPDPTRTPQPEKPRLRIVSPRSGEVVTGPVVEVVWEVDGFDVIPASQATRREDRHIHILLDRDASLYLKGAQPFPVGDPGIVHTANRLVTFQNVAPGRHRLDAITGCADHVAWKPPIADSRSFTVVGGPAQATATPTVTATATPTATTGATPTATPGGPTTVEATIANYVYLPDPIVISVGDTIRWSNLDDDVHTVTSEATDGNGQPLWTSPRLSLDEEYRQTFAERGTFFYICEPHPQMRAEITVR